MQAESTPPNVHGRVVDCYVRNSTAFQVDNWRAERQREELPRLVKQHGYTPGGESEELPYWDEQGVSGESLDKRKKMRAILARIEAGISRGVACVSFDRLSRDIDLIDGLVIWATCKERGAVIITPDKLWLPGESADDDTAFINFWLASRNKRQQLDQLFEGLVEKAANAPVIRGKPIHGYTLTYEQYVDDHGRLRVRSRRDVDPEVTELTRRLFADFPHHSARRLVAILNAEGPGSWKKRWNRDGTCTRVRWNAKQLLRLVRNPLYKGVVVWGKDARSRRVQKLLATYQGRAFVHDVAKFRIVDAATWGACQGPKDGSPTAYRRGEGRHPRTVGSAALFGALLKCPGCESPMYYRNTYLYLRGGRKLDPSYLCGKYHREASCGSHHVREAEVLDLIRPVARGVLERIDTETMLREEAARENATDKRPALETELRTIADAKAMLREDRYIKRIIGDADYEESLRSFNARQEAIEAELASWGTLGGGAGDGFGRLHAQLHPDRLEASLRRGSEAFWRTVLPLLFESVTLGYEYRGKRRKARVWLDPEGVVLRPEVEALLRQATLCPTGTLTEMVAPNVHSTLAGLVRAFEATAA